MNFIGRNEELRKINNIMTKNIFSTTLIYGRRRVGKSELVKYVLRQNSCLKIYYECKEVNEKSNVDSLSDTLSDALNLPRLAFNDFESILKYIFKLVISQKIILVLDEYSYLKKTIPDIDSIIQSLIDSFKEQSQLSFILLGSYVDIMKSLLLPANPLYGRIDLTINLKPMDYYDSSLFYPSFLNEDKIKLYSVFGGIPYYNRLIDSTKTI